jgi:type IV secretory pathway protease TraF
MPWWEGCRKIGQGELFLLMDSSLSFDGRYFGISRMEDLVGRAKLLWAR